MLHKFRKPEAVFQISQEWIITAPRRRNQSREETALASATVIKKSQNDNCCRKLRKLLARPPTPMGPSGLSWEGTPAASRAPYRDPALRGASLRVGSVQPGFCVTDTYTVRAEKWDTETRNARCYPRTQVSQNAPLECSEATEGFGVPGRTKPSSSTSDRGEISSFSALTAIVWHVKARWTSSTKLRGTVSMHWKAVRTHLISMMLPLAFGARSSRLGKDRRWQNSQQRQVLSAHSTGPATSSSYGASSEGTPHRGFQDFTPHWKQTSRAYHFLPYFFKAVVQVSTCVNHTERIYSKQYLSFGSGRWGAFSPSIWNLPWLGVAFGFYTKNKTKLNQKNWKKIESWTICNHKKHNHTRYTHATITFSLPLVY